MASGHVIFPQNENSFNLTIETYQRWWCDVDKNLFFRSSNENVCAIVWSGGCFSKSQREIFYAMQSKLVSVKWNAFVCERNSFWRQIYAVAFFVRTLSMGVSNIIVKNMMLFILVDAIAELNYTYLSIDLNLPNVYRIFFRKSHFCFCRNFLLIANRSRWPNKIAKK